MSLPADTEADDVDKDLYDQPLHPSDPGALSKAEITWRGRQKWLEQHGYMLRPRYHQSWRPSWKDSKKSFYDCEDGVSIWHGSIIDATRTSDGSLVVLKEIKKSRHPHEADIGLFFSAEPLASDPKNHCVPILEVLQVPDDEDLIVFVMPFLRAYRSPIFDTFGEAVAYFKQVFEGLQFMHVHHVAHRDCDGRNIMMDGVHLYPHGFHPMSAQMKPDLSGFAKHYSRTERPVKYYFIDFGISRRYSPDNEAPREPQILGGDQSVPEFRDSDEPMDPFPTDVYYLGNMIREDFINAKYGFEFMGPLVSDMVQDDPIKRPNMDEVVTRFENIQKSLNSWKLRSRVVERDAAPILNLYRFLVHWRRRINY
ncbi:hypothetical protein OE88DRAFT_1626029 [Heliocybe sulcata]|uniref:Protein kinase domain-containing protein n=1 Tax=Heliocybe sulcata TaxID=5364 RepID=A0A5C3N8Q7_9AGAM|nr:hypothetical protein OE88DRAFT_1626029 [Heliocybe sulcata]